MTPPDLSDALFLDGRWVPACSGRTEPLIDPGTGEPITTLPFGDREDVQAAMDGAALAQPAWAARTAYERGAILDRAADLIAERAPDYARRTVLESGKPLAQAKGEWAGAPGYLRSAAEEARRLGGRSIPARLANRRIDVTYAPLGVVGVITAWNFPVYNVNRAVSSALAVGNTVVLRPSDLTPLSAFDYARALRDAGLPPGVLQVVHGEAHPMGQAMLDDPRCRKIAFTGSARVGRLLMEGAARTVTRLSLELGGNAPVIVGPDVDVAAVARSGLVAKLRNAGQVCIAPQRFYVHASIVEEFTAALVAAAEAERPGHGLEAGSTLGPLISARHRERVEALVADSVALGARVVTGGRRVGERGFFYAPTILDQVPKNAPVLHEEVFGPVLPLVPWTDLDEVIRLANQTEYGLAAFLFTRDLKTAILTSERLEFGMVGINDWYPVTAEAPFGGVKQSGIGRESGAEGVLEYVEAKTRFWGGL